ncbi:MAG TPA: MFS transporter [Phycisphaerales bacterium]|nr:MFS transporter [Phycisphaerales bacterium]
MKLPISHLPNRGQIWSWISFDVANQSFTLLINTVLFSVYFTSVVYTKPNAEAVWGYMFAGSMLLVVLASPIVGAIADDRASKKRWLLGTGVICAALTCCLALLGPGSIWLALLFYIPANFCFNIGENFLASFLPQLAKRDDMARVSGFSWCIAYIAALLLLVLTAGAMLAFNLKDPSQWRPFFIFAGLWFIAFAIPTLINLREPPVDAPTPGNPIVVGFRRLLSSARSTAQFRDLLLILAGSFFYGMAMSVVIAFATILCQKLGFRDVQLIIFVAVVTVAGIFGTIIPAFFQDRIGHKRTVLSLLVVWVVATTGFAYYSFLFARGQAAQPPVTVAQWPMWLFACLVGFGLGSLGSANRAFVAYLTPPSRSAEVFGLWGLTFKLAAIGTIPFGIMLTRVGMPASLLTLTGFVLVGIFITMFVNEKRGVAAATQAEPAAST